jgi:hypothetical protein
MCCCVSWYAVFNVSMEPGAFIAMKKNEDVTQEVTLWIPSSEACLLSHSPPCLVCDGRSKYRKGFF